MNTRHHLFIGILFAVCFLIPQTVLANAFFIQEMSGDGMAQGSAVVAAGNKPSSMFQNAANLSYLDGLWIEASTTMYIPYGYFENVEGDKMYLGNTPIVTPHFFASYKINDWVAVGLGGFVDFGLAVEWPDDWEGKHIATKAGMQSFTINPNVSFGPFHGFSIALGFDAKWGSVEIKRAMTLGLAPLGEENVDNTLHLAGSTWGFGANVGLMYQPADWVRIGFGYRSGIKMALKDGDADFDVTSNFASRFPDQKFDATINLPHLISAGVRFWPIKELSVELDFWWTMWSSYDTLAFTFDQGLEEGPNQRLYSMSETKDFRDFLQARIGMEWWFHKYFALRAGFMLDGGVVPDETLDPTLPDNHRLNSCIGIGMDWNGLFVDIAYMWVHMIPRDVREVEGNPLPGKYVFDIHDLTFSIGYHYDFNLSKGS